MSTTLDPAVPVAPEPPAAPRRGVGVAVLFTATAFFGAALLFMIQPMAAKLLLPSYGGSATVWSTSSLFFQLLLLLGYGYSHVTTRRLGARRQPLVHVAVLLVPLLTLPLALPGDPTPGEEHQPVLWLLRTLFLMVGLPYLVLSTTGPLLQRWYSWSGGPRADDPYFMFAGSNLGSFVGLLSYPFLVEPFGTLAQQQRWWSAAFVVFLVLMAVCAFSVRGGRAAPGAADAVEPHLTEEVPAPSARTWLLWTALAFLPSSMMLAATSHLSTDIAPLPLLWVVPLAIYLATFIAAFARTSRRTPVAATRWAASVAAVAVLVSAAGGHLPTWLVVTVDLLCVALVGYAAHARLAAGRPGPAHLTGFYLVVSVGGALGGLLNGVVAPLLFNRVWEYGLTLALVPLLLVGTLPPAGPGWLGRYPRPVRIALVAAAFLVVGFCLLAALTLARGAGAWAVLVALGVAGLGAWWLTRLPVVLATGLAVAVLAVGIQAMSTSVLVDRTFYGSYRVNDTPTARELSHGTTVHGNQSRTEPGEPTLYYARTGPLGDLLGEAAPQRVGVVGLGTGAIAAYGRPGQSMTFVEIDPEMVRIAGDPDLFTYLADTPADVETVVGDGRLQLAEVPSGSYDLLVLDAFSSDAIPVHLLTEEALDSYARTLAPGGRMVVHISNRIFDLEPVLASAADRFGWSGAVGRGGNSGLGVSSVWVVLAPEAAATTDLTGEGWSPLTDRKVRWTDNFSSVLSVLR